MSEEDPRKARELRLTEWLKGPDFYNLMQVYRMMPISNQPDTVRAFEVVQGAIQQKVREIFEPELELEDFITVYRAVGGWNSVQMTWTKTDQHPSGGFWEPWTTGMGPYEKMEEALKDGQDWAENEELEFKVPKMES